MRISDAVKKTFEPVLSAMSQLPKAFDKELGILSARPGYRYEERNGKVGATPAIILACTPAGLLGSRAKATELETKYGVPVDAQVASTEEQLAAWSSPTRQVVVPDQWQRSAFEATLRGQVVPAFGARKAQYTAPATLKLPRIKAKMRVRLAVSPENGWKTLSPFLDTVQTSLTIGMYQFTAPNVAEGVNEAYKRVAKASGDLLLTLHPVPEKPGRGVKSNDRPESDVLGELRKTSAKSFGFQWAPVFGDGAQFASAYHIKVAVANGNRFWLSSGNWQSSNQPDDATTEKITRAVQRNYNREYHAVIDHEELAQVYEKFLKFDFETARTVNHPDPKSWDGPDVSVPRDYEPPAFVPPAIQTFDPFEDEREFDIQPLLTPDNYAERILEVITNAKKSLRFQNQYINLAAKENDPGFERLVEALIDRQSKIEDVRVICRDMMTQDKVDLLVAKGFDPSGIHFQPSCHNKCILVDDAIAVFGSHNWSNDGALFNRDASMILYDEDAAKYFNQVFDYDWQALATANAAKPRKSRVGDDSGDDDGVSFGELDDVMPT